MLPAHVPPYWFANALLSPVALTPLPPPCCCSKIQREVIDKERKAYAERQSQNLPRPMERRKLEGNIREFVKQSIRRLHSTQQQR